MNMVRKLTKPSRSKDGKALRRPRGKVVPAATTNSYLTRDMAAAGARRVHTK